jgi:hypothetical protein
MQPVLDYLYSTFPAVDSLHFISDSPATQYRCKNNFFLFSTLLYRYWKDKLKIATWNYMEAGHGKGAPDGVGGQLKRTADRLVGYGHDLCNANEVYTALSEAQSGVKLYFVGSNDITVVDKVLPIALSGVNGTMKIRQLVTMEYGVIYHRPLSCFCNWTTDKYSMCTCFKPTTVRFPNMPVDGNSGDDIGQYITVLPVASSGVSTLNLDADSSPPCARIHREMEGDVNTTMDVEDGPTHRINHADNSNRGIGQNTVTLPVAGLDVSILNLDVASSPPSVDIHCEMNGDVSLEMRVEDGPMHGINHADNSNQGIGQNTVTVPVAGLDVSTLNLDVDSSPPCELFSAKSFYGR